MTAREEGNYIVIGGAPVSRALGTKTMQSRRKPARSMGASLKKKQKKQMKP